MVASTVIKWHATTVNERGIGVAERALTKVQLMVYQRLRNKLYHTKGLRYVQD